MLFILPRYESWVGGE